MNLFNQAENQTLGDELVLLIDKWPNCDQERAIELQQAFNNFSDEGGWSNPEVENWGPRDGPIYLIKRDPERAAHFTQAMNEIQTIIGQRKVQ
jgi:hypothetical protein